MPGLKNSLLFAFLVCASIPGTCAPATQSALESARTSGVDLNKTLSNLQKTRIERELKKEMESSRDDKKPDQKAPAAEPAVPETRLKLKTVEFSESAILTREKLHEFAAGYENREVGISELKELTGKINNWYRTNGYITAMAILPPQEIKNGTLKVILFEGKIGKLKVEGNNSTRSDYIRDRLPILEGMLPEIRSIDKKLAWFNGTNDIKLRIKLQAGEKPGTTDCTILAFEPTTQTATLFFDTAGNKSTGESRTGLSYTDYSVSGRRDALNITALMSNSSKSGMLSYNRPINKRGTKVSVYTSSNELLIDTDGLSIRGNSNSTGVSLTHPITIKTHYRSELILDVHRQNSVNKAFGVTFVDDKENRYSIGQSFLKLSPDQAVYLKPAWVLCKYDGLGDDKSIQKFTVDGLWQKVISGKQQLNIKISGQKARDDFLPSADQFFLGGFYSVRGYDESIIGGDSGLNLKLDYLFPIGMKSTKMFAFYDWGKIYGKSYQTTSMIHSFGFGFNHSFINDSQIVLSVGYPVEKKIGGQVVDPHKVELSLNISF